VLSPSASLQLKTLQRIPLGRDSEVSLYLRSNKEISTISLNSATLEFRLERIGADKAKTVYGRKIIDNTRVIARQLPGGEEIRETISVPKDEALVGPQRELTRSFTLLQLFGRFVEPGDYVLIVEYENAISTEARFRVYIDRNETVPALIDLIEHQRLEIRVWARNTLFGLIGQPAWEPTAADGPLVVRANAESLRKWWMDNRRTWAEPDAGTEP